MIPKKIHYCWFGGNKKSNLILKCIDSWKKFFPDYEIIEWNENNTDIHENAYIEQAYKAKKWAFVSDYVRMKVLYAYGGIYFDTDVEVLKPFPKEILELEAFTGFEEFSLMVSPGLVFGCGAGNVIAKMMVESYDSDVFCNKSVDTIKTINVRITEMLVKNGLEKCDKKQIILGLTVFPSSVFCGYDGRRRKVDIRENTLSVHHYASSWFPWYRKIRLKIGTVKRRLLYFTKKPE